jgi:murein DD-endopeptidase MepM/ murein hydrolase activator NlpD
MNKGVASDMILTVGVLLAIGLALLQLRALIFGQTKTAQENVLYSFARDIQRIIQKSDSIAGNTTFIYEPDIKEYAVLIFDGEIEINDAVTGKNISFSDSQVELVNDYFGNSEKIYIRKVNGYGLISDRLCREKTENCEIDFQCCSNHCWTTGSEFTCQDDCAPVGAKVPHSFSCCSGAMDPNTGRCIEWDNKKNIGSGQLMSCPTSIDSYADDYNEYREAIYDAIEKQGLDKYLPKDNAARLVAAVITQESRWNQDACGSSGCGLMQITGGSVGDCSYSWDEIVEDPYKNIDCGVDLLVGKFAYLDSYNDYDFDNLLKISLAGYNGGQATVADAISNAGESKWEIFGTVENLAESVEKYYAGTDPSTVSYCAAAGDDQFECKARIIIVYVDAVNGYYQDWLECEEKSGGGEVSGLLWPTVSKGVYITVCHGDPIWYGIHSGIDISRRPSLDGEPVYAPSNGKVVKTGSNSASGNYIIIKLDNSDFYAVFLHLKAFRKSEGDTVRQGDTVAIIDNTGEATTATHLHFHLQKSPDLWAGAEYDPCEYFAAEGKSICNKYCG